MKIEILLLTISVCLDFVVAQQSQLGLPPCRFTIDADFNLLECQQIDQCTRQQPSSSAVCNRYSYSTISEMSVCIETCCFELQPVPETLTSDLVRECYSQYQLRYTLFIITILGSVFGSVFFLMSICCIFMYCFVKNPYSGQRVFVGACCCKKNIDFEADHQKKMKNNENNSQTQKGVMERHEKKRPNLIIDY